MFKVLISCVIGFIYVVNSLQCMREGFFQNQTNSSRFYHCVKLNPEINDYTIYHYGCPNDLVFSDSEQVCVARKTVDADDGAIAEIKYWKKTQDAIDEKNAENNYYKKRQDAKQDFTHFSNVYEFQNGKREERKDITTQNNTVPKVTSQVHGEQCKDGLTCLYETLCDGYGYSHNEKNLGPARRALAPVALELWSQCGSIPGHDRRLLSSEPQKVCCKPKTIEQCKDGLTCLYETLCDGYGYSHNEKNLGPARRALAPVALETWSQCGSIPGHGRGLLSPQPAAQKVCCKPKKN